MSTSHSPIHRKSLYNKQHIDKLIRDHKLNELQQARPENVEHRQFFENRQKYLNSLLHEPEKFIRKLDADKKGTKLTRLVDHSIVKRNVVDYNKYFQEEDEEKVEKPSSLYEQIGEWKNRYWHTPRQQIGGREQGLM